MSLGVSSSCTQRVGHHRVFESNTGDSCQKSVISRNKSPWQGKNIIWLRMNTIGRLGWSNLAVIVVCWQSFMTGKAKIKVEGTVGFPSFQRNPSLMTLHWQGFGSSSKFQVPDLAVPLSKWSRCRYSNLTTPVRFYWHGKWMAFTESDPRPIESISRNVREEAAAAAKMLSNFECLKKSLSYPFRKVLGQNDWLQTNKKSLQKSNERSVFSELVTFAQKWS